jgi:hypothetical protein
MFKKNESLPLPTTANINTITSTTNNDLSPGGGYIQNKQFIFNSSIKYKYTRIADGYPHFTLNNSHYLIEFCSSDTTKIILPKIDDEKSIFYIIRKHYIGTVSLLPHNEDNIEGDISITITSDDQIIQLTNDSLHTWLLI